MWWENLPFLLLNGGIGMAVIFLTARVFNYLQERDANASETEQAQTATYTGIINNQAQLIHELRASSERREAEYQRHNQAIVASLTSLGDTQVSQVSVLRDIHQSNDRLEKTQRITLDGVQTTSANVIEVRAAVDHVLEQLEQSISTFTTALSAHDDNAKERNEALVRSIRNSNDLVTTLREAIGRIEDTLQQLREMVQPTPLMYGLGVDEVEEAADNPSSGDSRSAGADDPPSSSPRSAGGEQSFAEMKAETSENANATETDK